MEKIKVTSIKIKNTDGKEIELSIEDAKELYIQLRELFGDKQVIIKSEPIIIEQYRKWHDDWNRPYYYPYWPSTTGKLDIKYTGEAVGGSIGNYNS